MYYTPCIITVLNETFLTGTLAYTVLLYWVYCSFPRSPNDPAASPDITASEAESLFQLRNKYQCVSSPLNHSLYGCCRPERRDTYSMASVNNQVKWATLWNTSNSAIIPRGDLLLGALCLLRLTTCSVGLCYFKQHTRTCYEHLKEQVRCVFNQLHCEVQKQRFILHRFLWIFSIKWSLKDDILSSSYNSVTLWSQTSHLWTTIIVPTLYKHICFYFVCMSYFSGCLVLFIYAFSRRWGLHNNTKHIPGSCT